MIASRTPEPRRHIYRCYFLDEQGRFLDFELIDCTTDSEAIGRARRLFADRDYCSRFEVWDGARRRWRYEPDSRAASPIEAIAAVR